MTRIVSTPLTYSCIFEGCKYTTEDRSILLKHYRTVHKHKDQVDSIFAVKGSDYLF